MADFLVERDASNGQLTVHNYAQFREEELLVRPTGLVPGRDFVVISNETTWERAREQARAYFEGEHQSSLNIDCWVTGALARQACLKTTP